MVKKIYFDGYYYLRQYLEAVKSEGEERFYRFKKLSRREVIAYARFVDDEERIGVSYVVVKPNCYPGKRPFFTHKALAFAFLDKQTGKLNTKELGTLMNVITDPRVLLNVPQLQKFFPVSLAYIEARRKPVRLGDDDVDFCYLSYTTTMVNKGTKYRFQVGCSVMFSLATLVLESRTVLKGILKGKINNFGEALEKRFRFPKMKFTNKELQMIFFAFGYPGLKYYPYVATGRSGLMYQAELYASVAARSQSDKSKPIKLECFDNKNGMTGYYRDIQDLLDMSAQLGRKINFGWSPARMEEEHKSCTDLLTAFKLKSEPYQEIEFKVAPPEIPGITVLKSTHEFVKESVEMNHCVGTSGWYFEECKQLKAMILSTNFDGERGTAHVRPLVSRLKNGKPEFSMKISQFRAKYNNPPSDKAVEALNERLKLLACTSFIEQFLEKEEIEKPSYTHVPAPREVLVDNDDLWPF